MVQGSDLPEGVEPTEQDTVLIGDDRWNIKKVATYPLDLIFILSIDRA